MFRSAFTVIVNSMNFCSFQLVVNTFKFVLASFDITTELLKNATTILPDGADGVETTVAAGKLISCSQNGSISITSVAC